MRWTRFGNLCASVLLCWSASFSAPSQITDPTASIEAVVVTDTTLRVTISESSSPELPLRVKVVTVPENVTILQATVNPPWPKAPPAVTGLDPGRLYSVTAHPVLAGELQTGVEVQQRTTLFGKNPVGPDGRIRPQLRAILRSGTQGLFTSLAASFEAQGNTDGQDATIHAVKMWYRDLVNAEIARRQADLGLVE